MQGVARLHIIVIKGDLQAAGLGVVVGAIEPPLLDPGLEHPVIAPRASWRGSPLS